MDIDIANTKSMKLMPLDVLGDFVCLRFDCGGKGVEVGQDLCPLTQISERQLSDDK
jgi:hypothetical protein